VARKITATTRQVISTSSPPPRKGMFARGPFAFGY
jgi:hypothetical protein